MSRSEADRLSGEAHAGVSSTRRPFPVVRVWILAIVAGSLAGSASWLIGEILHPRFDRPAPAAPGPISSADAVSSRFRAERDAQELEAILTFGMLGGVLGLALGLAGGSARGSARAALSGAIVGWMLGSAVGAALTWVILPLYYRILDPDTNELVVGILIHVVLSSAVGAAGGAAFGVGLGGRSRTVRAILGGLMGAIAGAVVYEIAGAVAFPLAKTSSPIAVTWGARLLARLTVTILASAGVAIGALDQVKRAIPSPVNEGHES